MLRFGSTTRADKDASNMCLQVHQHELRVLHRPTPAPIRECIHCLSAGNLEERLNVRASSHAYAHSVDTVSCVAGKNKLSSDKCPYPFLMHVMRWSNCTGIRSQEDRFGFWPDLVDACSSR